MQYAANAQQMQQLDEDMLARVSGGAYFWDDLNANLNADASKLIPFPDRS